MSTKIVIKEIDHVLKILSSSVITWIKKETLISRVSTTSVSIKIAEIKFYEN